MKIDYQIRKIISMMISKGDDKMELKYETSLGDYIDAGVLRTCRIKWQYYYGIIFFENCFTNMYVDIPNLSSLLWCNSQYMDDFCSSFYNYNCCIFYDRSYAKITIQNPV